MVLCEAQTGEPLNGIAFLLGHGDLVRPRGQRSVVVAARLAKQGEELIRVLGDRLGELRVAGAELLENGLEHLGLLLHHLAELLELGVVTEKLEVPEALRGGCGSRACTRARTASTARARAAALLGGQVEQVHVPVIIATTGRGSGGGGGSSSRGSLGGRSSGSLEMLGDALNR